MDPVDPTGLAAAAAAAVGGYLVRLLSSAAGQAADKAGGQLVRLVSDRLQATRVGRGVLGELQEEPGDPARRAAVADVLADELARDPAFARTLTKHLRTKHDVSASGDGNVVSTGAWDNRRGAIATGTSRIDQSRHIRFSGGLAGW